MYVAMRPIFLSRIFFHFSKFEILYTPDGKSRHPSPFSRCFSCKTAFLKWIFEADPVGVQIRTVSHFKGFE